MKSSAAALVAVLLVGLMPATAAFAVDVRGSGTTRVLGDITHERIEIRLPAGAVARGDVLRFREDDPDVRLRPRLARGTVAGLEQMVPMSRNRLQRGAIAGVNGGYSLPRPGGAPNGLHVNSGWMVSGQAVTGFGTGGRPTGRGMVGIQPGGRMVMDEILVDLVLDRPDTDVAPQIVDELNRQPWPPSAVRSNDEPWRPDGEILLYDERFGAPIAVPADATIAVLEGLEVRTSGRTEGRVIDVRRTTGNTIFPVPAGSYVLLAYGVRAEAVADLVVGQAVGVATTITPKRTAADGWRELNDAVAGGQLMVQDGQRRPGSEWTSYAAFSDAHANARQPRTAIGRTADGQGLLVTVDGRRPGWSVGLTVRELADAMMALGAVDAVNLDGGGSTTMTVNAQIRNRPSEVGRSVADGLFLHVPLPPETRSLDNACPADEVPPSGFADVPGTTHAAPITCLAWWGVTSGVSPTRYAPADGVTREQMASFVVAWIDGISERGDGRELPTTDRRVFADVTEANVHAASIARLSDAGIIQGRSATTFDPRSVMTRGQTASLLRGALEYVTEDALPAGRDTFLDDNTSVHEANIDALAAIGVITGTGGYEFAPDGRVTRGAMAALIMRSSDLVVEQERTTPPS